MTIEECYQELGGNYASVSSRIPGSKLIEKFIGKFLDDRSFETLCIQIQAGNREGAFRAAHTLKGVCANLSLDRLQKSAGRLTEILRAEEAVIPETAEVEFEKVKKDYAETVSVIRRYFDK